MGDDEDLTTTVEEQLASDDNPDSDQTQPLSKEDLADLKVEPHSDQELARENAETSLDQPSDSTS